MRVFTVVAICYLLTVSCSMCLLGLFSSAAVEFAQERHPACISMLDVQFNDFTEVQSNP